LIRVREEARVHPVTGDSESRVARIVSQQKEKIRRLEGLLIQAKVDFENLLMQTHTETDKSTTQQPEKESPAGGDLEEALRAIIDLREEFAHKLRSQQEKHEQVEQELKASHDGMRIKFESQKHQLELMEKKEIRQNA
jgi:hypothetical protein